MSVASSSKAGRVSAAEAIAWLAQQRRAPDRQSATVVEYGELVLEGGHLKKLGNDVWSFLEQVALGALDMGKRDLAELCVSRLNTRFPDSARVAALQGMLLEARGEYKQALKLYDNILAKDESSLVIVKRMVAVLKCMPPSADGRTGPAGAAAALTKYLDTYYTDSEAWQELVAIYLEQNMYPQAAHALEELLLLVPHNAFFVLQYAEVLATQGELALAYKEYLRVLEMCEGKTAGAQTDTGGAEDLRQGPFARALWGLKLVTSKLRASDGSQGNTTALQQRKGGKASSSDQPAITPAKLDAVDAMVTDLLLNKVYKGASPGVQATREAARKVLGA